MRILKLDGDRVAVSPSAMQPTSSASSADAEMALQSIDRLKLIRVWDDLGRIPNGGAFHAELDVLFKRVATLASKAIVPQVVQAPTDEQIDEAAKMMAECMDYPWQEMPEQGKATMRKHVQSILDFVLSNTAQGKPEQDAARYQVLRNREIDNWYIGPEVETDECGGTLVYHSHWGDELDAAIDAALAAKKG